MKVEDFKEKVADCDIVNVVADSIDDVSKLILAINDNNEEEVLKLVKQLFIGTLQYAKAEEIVLDASIEYLENENKAFNIIKDALNEKKIGDDELRMMCINKAFNVTRAFTTLYSFALSKNHINESLFNITATIGTYVELLITSLTFIGRCYDPEFVTKFFK